SLALLEGSNPTSIPYLSVGRRERPRALIPVTLEPSICVILQGEKSLFCDGEVLSYPAGTFIASTRYSAAAAAVSQATRRHPYIGLRLDFIRSEIAAVILEAGLGNSWEGDSFKRSVNWIEDDLIDLLTKIVKLQSEPKDIAYLSNLLRRELIYRLLKSSNGPSLVSDFALDRTDDAVTKVIEWLKANFQEPVVISDLARLHAMSVSTLHHLFKAMTGMGPIQFQKQLRLQEARRLIITEGERPSKTNLEMHSASSFDTSDSF
ncbi:MAG: AraC family transcriptional regulator, partial [Proteobacteria bacterium]